MYKCNILLANMCRMNAAMHALLHTNNTDNILATQEPWFGQIGTQRVDGERAGTAVKGGVKHPDWNVFYPYYTSDRIAKVITYVRKFSRTHNRKLSPIRTVPRLDLARHPTLLITDHYIGTTLLRLINFYHDVVDKTSLRSLLTLDLDPTVPTLLIGDFNLHSYSWSPPGLSPSPWSRNLEAWAAAQTFDLETSPGDITRRNHDGECPSTLDLTWHNLAAAVSTPLTPPTIDWAATLGSDHASIRTL